MSKLKQRLLRRLDTMTHPLQMRAVMAYTPKLDISMIELPADEQERFVALQQPYTGQIPHD